MISEITTYLEDDWDDNALSSRSNTDEGYFLHPSDGLTGAGDYEPGSALKGVYRPEWRTENGSPGTSSGVLVIGGGDEVSTPSAATIGTFQFDFQNQSSPSGSNFNHDFIRQDGDNRYLNYNDVNNGDHVIAKRSSGTTTKLTAGSAITDTNWHTTKVTRDSYGNLELLVDGTSKGTATDTFLPEPKYQHLNTGGTYPTTHVDNLVMQ